MFDTLERGLYWLSSFLLEADTDAACQLRAPVNEHTFVTINGDLLTLIEVTGSRRLIGRAETDYHSAVLAKKLREYQTLGNGQQHSFGFGFRSNPNSVKRLEDLYTASMNTAVRLGADAKYLFQDRILKLSKKCTDEVCVIVMMTHKNGFTPNEKKRYSEASGKSAAAVIRRSGVSMDDDFSQSPRPTSSLLVQRHEALLSTIREDFMNENVGISVLLRVLNCHAAVNVMRRFLDASPFPPGWRPRLLGDDALAINNPRGNKSDHLFPPRIGRQMITQGFEEMFTDAEIIKSGRYYYASAVLEVFPQEDPSPTFADLSAKIGRNIPWSFNLEMSPNGLSFNKMEQFFASFIGGFGEENKQVKSAWDELRRMQQNGDYVTAVRVVFTTWADSETKVIDNISFLKTSLQSWGSANVSNETGAPGSVHLASSPGYTAKIPAPYLPAPIDAVSRTLPIFRPSSVWDDGQIVLHTPQGRPYPIMFGSTLQNFWGTIVFAPTGYGKSFLMNMINSGILFSPGLKELPYTVVVDVGKSSQALVNLAKAILPPELARQVVAIRVRNDPRYAVNPFDTQLGLDQPTPTDRDFQLAVVSTLCPNLGPEGDRYILRVLDAAYRRTSRNSQTPKLWQRSLDNDLSAKLDELNFSLETRTRVWDIVDFFFDNEMVDDAVAAQRYAVPTLQDMIPACRDASVMDLFGTVPTPTGENISDVFMRNITTALSEYAMLTGVTKFDVGSARFLSVDLEEVLASSSSEEGRRRSGLMYLFARRLGARNFFMRWEEIEALTPERYAAYQKRRVTKLWEGLKFLEYDEIHNASGIESVQKLIQKDAREGRKYNVATMLSSQLLKDFPPDLVENTFTFFILGAGSRVGLAELQRSFGLSESETLAIMNECTGPGKLFAMFKTVVGTLSQVLHTTAGPIETWAFNSSAADSPIRDAMYELVGPKEALIFLARRFPDGTARPFIEQFKLQMNVQDDGHGDEGVTKAVVRRLYSEYQSLAEKLASGQAA